MPLSFENHVLSGSAQFCSCDGEKMPLFQVNLGQKLCLSYMMLRHILAIYSLIAYPFEK